jgi:hypothetical protein
MNIVLLRQAQCWIAMALRELVVEALRLILQTSNFSIGFNIVDCPTYVQLKCFPIPDSVT